MMFLVDMEVKDLIFGDKIGAGRCSNVYKALNTKTDEYVAVKIINKSIQPSTIDFEIYSNLKLYHRDIIKCYGWFENDRNAYILYEYATSGDLFEYLSSSDELLSEAQVKHILKPVIRATVHIHEKKWIHRDIKTENILLFRGVEAKLGDLEFAMNTNKYVPTGQVGTPSHMAPEVMDCDEMRILELKGEPGYSYEIDCWSIGVLAYECLLKTPPFEGKNMEEIRESIKKYDINFWNISENARDFVLRCLELDPSKRIKSHEMLSHEWFNEKKKCCLRFY